MRHVTLRATRCLAVALVIGLAPTVTLAAPAQERPSREEQQAAERRAAAELQEQEAARRRAAERETAEQRRQAAAEQERGDARRDAAAEQERGDARREAAAEKERAEARRRAAEGHAAGSQLPVAEQRALAAEIAHQETTHRARLAKLERLAALAREGGDSRRLAAVEELRKKELQNHERKMKRFAERLGPDGARVVERAVNHGRERRASTPAARRAALQAWEKEHPGRSHGVRGHERGAAGHGERASGASTERGRPQEGGAARERGAGNGSQGRERGDDRPARGGRDG